MLGLGHHRLRIVRLHPFFVGASVDVGIAGTTTTFGSFTLVQNTGNYSAPQVTSQAPAAAVVATINGAPAAGVGTVLVFFALPTA